MSGGYDVGGCEVLNENGDAVSEESSRRLSCVFCKLFLRDVYQLSCGDRACKRCIPSLIFSCPNSHCPDGDDDIDPDKCFTDRSCQSELSSLRVLCQCSEKIALKDWEIHCKSCPEVDEFHLPQEGNYAESLEQRLPPPESDLGATQHLFSRNPTQTLEQKANLHDVLKLAPKNESVTLSGNVVSNPQDSPPLNRIPSSGMVVPQPATTLQEDKWDLKQYIDPTSSPVVVGILNANDSYYTNSQCSVTPLVSTKESPTEPKLDANKTIELLKPVFLDYGIPVIPVLNKSVRCLFELLQNIKCHKLPESVQLVIFKSSTHGRCDEICMNGVYVSIPDLVHELTKIDCPNFFAIFEGCQRGYGSFHFEKVDKSYSAMYSVPPQSTSYHQHGVGVLARCLAKRLSIPHKKSLKDLVEDLRHEFDKELDNIFGDKKPKGMKPIYVENYSPRTINPYSMISSAMKPRVEQFSQHNPKVTLDVRVPERLICHPSGEMFELKELLVTLTGGRHGKDILARSAKEYGEYWQVTIELPLQTEKIVGSLEVVACYKDGRKESCEPLQLELPMYDLPKISSCAKDNCMMAITFVAKEEYQTESRKYEVSHVQWRYQPHGDWVELHEFRRSADEQTCTVTIPHFCPDDPTEYKVQIRKYCAGTSTYVESDLMNIEELPKLRQPEGVSIARKCCCSGKTVTFRVNKCCDQLETPECGVKYWTKNESKPEYVYAPDHNYGEIQIEIPFPANKLQAVVKYNNDVEVLSDSCHSENSCCQDIVHKMRRYICEKKCRACCQLSCLLTEGASILTLVLLVVAAFNVFPAISSRDVIVSNTTIDHSLLHLNCWKSLFYKEIRIELYIIPASDNPNIILSIFTTGTMKRQSLKANLSNISMHLLGDGKQCQYLPNEYNNPIYYLAGSSISGRTSIDLPGTDDSLHSAMLFAVTSYYQDFEKRCFDERKLLQPIMTANLSSADGSKDFKLGTLKHNTYVYLIVQTDASSEVDICLNLDLDIRYYQGLNDMRTSSYDIIGNVSSNHNLSIPVDFGKGITYYMFAHDVGEDACQIVHVNITLVPRNKFEIGSIGAVGALGLLITVALFGSCCCCKRKCCKRKPLGNIVIADHSINSDPRNKNNSNETEPLLLQDRHDVCA